MQSIKINDELTLQPAGMLDAPFLFDIKNEDAARASALATKSEIRWDDHIAWLRQTLCKDDVELYIIMGADGWPLGSWRFDHHPDHEEFSMIVIPQARGKRVGSTVFNFCSDYIQERTKKKIVGFIAEGNVPPMRYHMRAGYQLESYDRERKCYVWTRDYDAFLLRKSKSVQRPD